MVTLLDISTKKFRQKEFSIILISS